MSTFRKITAGLSLLILRLTLSAWIGAAALFVITSVAEQTSKSLDSVTRDQLATIRFPLYYRFGFAAHGVGGLFAVTGLLTCQPAARRRLFVVLSLIVLSVALISLDYVYVYQPLQQLITPPGQPRNQEFIRLHMWSRSMNEGHVSMMLLAGIAACFPVNRQRSHDG